MAVQMNAARWIWRLIQFATSAMLIYLIIFVNESVPWKQTQVKTNDEQEIQK
jgi:hypothetical protein